MGGKEGRKDGREGKEVERRLRRAGSVPSMIRLLTTPYVSHLRCLGHRIH